MPIRQLVFRNLQLMTQDYCVCKKNAVLGRAVAQAVGRRFPAEAAQVRARVRTCGICGGQNGSGAGFLQVLRFSLQSIPPIAPHSSTSIIIRGWYNRPAVAWVLVDSVPFHNKKKKKSSVIQDKMSGAWLHYKAFSFVNRIISLLQTWILALTVSAIKQYHVSRSHPHHHLPLTNHQTQSIKRLMDPFITTMNCAGAASLGLPVMLFGSSIITT
jgi:hypothetical protein